MSDSRHTSAHDRREDLMIRIRRLGWPPYFVVAISLVAALICVGLVTSGTVKDTFALILLGTAGVAGVISVISLAVLAYQVRQSARDPEDTHEKGILDYLILGALPFVVLLGGVFAYFQLQDRSESELPPQLSTTFFLSFSVIALLLALSMTAIFYSWGKLADAKQPLGLPEGSVRAVIALALIIIFAITAVFLYTQVSRSTVLTSTGLTADQVALIPSDERLDTVPEPLATAAPGATPGPQTYTVKRLDPAQRTGNDLAQQIVTTVSTLVVAVSAFYFGSSSVKSATDALAAAAAGMGMRIVAPRQKSRLRKTGDSYDLVDIVVESTPPNQAVNGEIVSGDPQGKIAQIEPGSFTYKPVSPDSKVLIRFELVGDASTNATLVLLPPDGDASAPATPAPASPPAGPVGPTGDDDVADGTPGDVPPPKAPPGADAGGRSTSPTSGGSPPAAEPRKPSRARRGGNLVAVGEPLPDSLERDKADVPPEDPDDGEADDAGEADGTPEVIAGVQPNVPAPMADQPPAPAPPPVPPPGSDAPPPGATEPMVDLQGTSDEAMLEILDQRGGRRRKRGGFFSAE